MSVYSTQLATQTAAYGYASGTSMACPHVAGVLALGKAAAPDATKEELLDCLYETARNVDGSNGAYAGNCLLYTSPSPRDLSTSRMPSSA